MREFFVIVNPAAGGGRCGKRAPVALARLREGGCALEVHETKAKDDGVSLARRAYQDGARSFLAVGGDGTSHEIINGIFSLGAVDPITLGMLPLGTGNSFLRDFGIDSGGKALDALFRGQEHDCDVVAATHDDGVVHYMNLLSLGFSAEVGALTNRKLKPLGTAGYVLAVLACVGHLRHPVIEYRIDGGSAAETRPASLVSFCNSRFTGGSMMMAPHADVGDGLVDVIRVGEMGRARFVGTLPRLFRGTHVDRPEVSETRAARIDFHDLQQQDVMIDGEIMNLRLKSLTVLPSAMKVIA